MKSADEILKKMIDIMPYQCPVEVHIYILEAMRIFANEACIEQRKICLENVIDCELNLCNNEDAVYNAIVGAILAVIP
jgi:hypothetical protein